MVQRLRWVEPGVFMMGSSEEERGRVAGEISEDFWKRHIGNEGPQHQVTLTRGFWLSDTACTQALWLAVIGGRTRAVSMVIWSDPWTVLVGMTSMSVFFLPFSSS